MFDHIHQQTPHTITDNGSTCKDDENNGGNTYKLLIDELRHRLDDDPPPLLDVISINRDRNKTQLQSQLIEEFELMKQTFSYLNLKSQAEVLALSEELDKLQRLCEKNDIHFINDMHVDIPTNDIAG
eukprot:GHVR01084386.1.p1 GENE.GHVR01084386.1~~GHVR01084386.1.p1  ORF type:complete len:127 (+),score=35.39 GHVR01084386.1:57-437(+)